MMIGHTQRIDILYRTIEDIESKTAIPRERKDQVKAIIEDRKNRQELNRIGSLALDDAGLNTAAMVDEFSQTSKPRFDLANLLTNVNIFFEVAFSIPGGEISASI